MPAQGDLRYMMQRSLMLLLSDVRPHDNSHEEVLDFLPEYGRAERLEGPHLLPLILLINLWSSTSGLCEKILPSLCLPIGWTHSTVEMRANFSGGTVDWGETFRRRGIGEKGYAVRDRRKEVGRSHAEYVSLILRESLIHCKMIPELVRQAIGPNVKEPLNNIIRGIEQREEQIRKVLVDKFGAFYGSPDPRLRIAEQLLEEMTSSPDKFPRGLRDYAQRMQVPPPAGSFTIDSVERLTHWRSQYLTCAVWLSSRTGFMLRQKNDIEHLYEMWCFMELCIAARRSGLGETIQRSFIARERSRPEFVLGSGHYVYYDYRAAKFRNPALDLQHHLREAGILRPALAGTFVEWFILDPGNYQESVVVDVKCSRWNSREALKMLGYLMSFGVRRGILMFAERFNPAAVAGIEITEGLSRVDCPGKPTPQLWIASLVPARKEESSNFRILDHLLGEIFPSIPKPPELP